VNLFVLSVSSNRMNKVVFALLLFVAVAFAAGETCETGETLTLGELYEGDTTKASDTSIECQLFKYPAKGHWYTYQGQGKTVVLDTCDQRTSFDSVIFIFSSCEKTSGVIDQCLYMDDDGCNQQQSRIVFAAEAMHTYHIFVAGFYNQTGTYYLASSEVLPPDNYRCSKAIDVKSYPYSAEGETGTCRQVNDVCQSTHSSGLWYKVHGDGHPFVAHTCSKNTNFDTVIGVFGECDEEAGEADGCITYNNDACYRSSLVSWRSVQDSTYWLFVTGLNNARGRFTLAIEEREMNPNSHCYESIAITALPFYYHGSTDHLDTTFSECRNADGQHAMFFRMQGSNRKIIATTCTSSHEVNDTVIDVYSECQPKDASSHPGSGKICVGFNDDYCSLGASVVFNAASQSYFIAVSAASPSLEGVEFSLQVSAYEEVENSQCWFAEEIDSDPDVLLGNTTNMAPCEQTCDGSKSERRGGWFRYTHYGETKLVTASTCNGFNMLNARIEVYRSCTDRTCVLTARPTAQGCTNATFKVEDGHTYNLFVTDDDPNGPGGYFHVDFYDAEPNPHGKCDDAYFVNRGQLPYRLEDSTIATDPSWSECQKAEKKGVWVTVIGTGNKIVATTCDEHTGYDTFLELYDHCPEEEHHPEYCLNYSDDSPSCNRASEIEWYSQSGAYYWLFVTGYSSTTGIFVLKIYEKVSMINAKCQGAVGIRSLPYYDYGYTVYSDITNATCSKNARKGNWYELVGNDHWITISTCGPATDYASEVEVYLGCSENGGEVCVAHSHDLVCAPKTQISFAATKDTLFYIFVTGVDEAVMSEGFFGMTVSQGEKLPHAGSSSSGEEGLTPFEGFLVSVAVLMGIGLITAGCAIAYGLYKRHHVSYQEIPSSS